ncbi:MAG: hypothetical protein ACYS14_09230 [Planctomycetota bacterium]|jgi:hypothetical protein
MKEDENILKKAIEALKNEHVPSGPPQELIDATVTKLTETRGRSETAPPGSRIRISERFAGVRGIAKFAAAALLLIGAGYATGRFSAPRPPDMQQLQAALEPAIRKNVVAQLGSDLQIGLASGYAQLRDELDHQHRQDMVRVAAKILAASNSATRELLAALVESIDVAQTEQRQWFTAAIEQVELNRLRDSTAFASFAVRTEDELRRTQEGVVQLLSYNLADDSVMCEFENSKDPDERKN